MAIVKAQVKKQYHLESLMMLRLLASGTKLTDAVMNKLGLKAGVAQVKAEDGTITTKGKSGDHIHFAYDPESKKTYIYKADEGSLIGATKSFTSSGLRARLMEMANGATIENGEGAVSPETEIKGGLQIRFKVADEPVNDDGTDFYEVTFDKAILASKEEEGEEEAIAPTPAPKAQATSDSDWK